MKGRKGTQDGVICVNKRSLNIKATVPAIFFIYSLTSFLEKKCNDNNNN